MSITLKKMMNFSEIRKSLQNAAQIKAPIKVTSANVPQQTSGSNSTKKDTSHDKQNKQCQWNQDVLKKYRETLNEPSVIQKDFFNISPIRNNAEQNISRLFNTLNIFALNFNILKLIMSNQIV